MNLRIAFNAFAVIFVICGSTSKACAGNVDLKPGRYEITVTYEVQHERQNQSRTAVRCIRPVDLESPERVFNDRTDSAPKPGEICTVKGLRSSAGKISYDADCSNRTVHVEGSVDALGFSVVRTVRPRAGQTVPLKFMIRGRRTGNCLEMGGGNNSPRN